MPNPLRSEAEMFRVVVIVGVAAGAVIAVSVAISPLAGALLGLVLIVAALVLVVRAWRASREPTARDAR